MSDPLPGSRNKEAVTLRALTRTPGMDLRSNAGRNCRSSVRTGDRTELTHSLRARYRVQYTIPVAPATMDAKAMYRVSAGVGKRFPRNGPPKPWMTGIKPPTWRPIEARSLRCFHQRGIVVNSRLF